jgi:hypothetical protein
MPTDPTHPSAAAPTHPLDQPVSAETGAKLLAFLGLTEGEALQLLAAREVSPASLKETQHVDLHTLALSVPEDAIHSLATDPKVDLGDHLGDFEERCSRVRYSASAEDKLEHLKTNLHNSARLDGSAVQDVLSKLSGQLSQRARLNPTVRKLYAPLLAYHHSRYPGAKGAHPAADTVTPAEVKK